VKGGAEGWAVGRREAMCSAVSGKSLARTLHSRPMAQASAPSSGSLDREQHTPGAVLSSDQMGWSVERETYGQVSMAGACVRADSGLRKSLCRLYGMPRRVQTIRRNWRSCRLDRVGPGPDAGRTRAG
jgi:hypothetical protein